MKITQLTLTATGLFAAAWLGLSTETQGFSTIPGTLGTGQRDFRIFDNFTDAQANNNTIENVNFPGYTGAEMAIWKGVIEWGSLLHGTGNGDPSQTGDLGSGGANFDASFQGNANGVGTTNQNIHSELGGNGGGVLAFCETPISDGWRIRYYQNWLWQDGPGTSFGSGIDLQGVACHEYGHALGLGHSNVGGATMLPSISGNGTNARSINFDDAAGVQFKYGVIDGGKPIITAVAVSGTNVTILGSNFHGSDNDIWFTQAGTGGTGTPVTVSNVGSSAGGTRIDVTLPGAAGPGDILVRNQNGTHSSISNAWPFDPESCSPPVNYCVAAAHSEGPGAIMGLIGTASVADNNFTLEVNDAPANKSGIFYYGPNQIQTSFGDGFRCVGGATKRLPIVTTDFVGYASFTLDLSTAPNISAGANQNFQFWFRDPMGPGGNGFNTSDGLAVLFCD